MDVLETKIVVLFILAIVSFLIGLSTIPISTLLGLGSESGRTHRLVTSFLLCLGGGVLLATAMLHILPEISEELAETGEKLGIEFLPHLILCSGFFLIYLVEEVVELVIGDAHEVLGVSHNHSAESHNDTERSRETYGSTTDENTRIVADRSRSGSFSQDKSSILRDFLTILALSTHAVFEGLAAGLEHHTEDVWTMFGAIASHKFVISFCVCLEFLQHGVKRALFFTHLTVYSLMSSVGIAIGILITENEGSSVSPVVSATLEGIAGGTIIYVVMFEIFSRERAKDVPGLLQFAAIIIGFLIMMIIQIFAHHEHEEGEEEFGMSLSSKSNWTQYHPLAPQTNSSLMSVIEVLEDY